MAVIGKAAKGSGRSKERQRTEVPDAKADLVDRRRDGRPRHDLLRWGRWVQTGCNSAYKLAVYACVLICVAVWPCGRVWRACACLCRLCEWERMGGGTHGHVLDVEVREPDGPGEVRPHRHLHPCGRNAPSRNGRQMKAKGSRHRGERKAERRSCSQPTGPGRLPGRRAGRAARAVRILRGRSTTDQEVLQHSW